MNAKRTRGFTTAVCVAALFLRAAPLGADGTIDMIEHIFGATNIHAVTGHGRLTVAVSEEGDATVLSWPNPSFVDQLGYVSSNAVDARARPRFGAPEGAGLFVGLLVEHTGGAREVLWLRDATVWSTTQSYGAEDGPNIETRHVAPTRGLAVTVIDAIDPSLDRDLWVRRVELGRDATSTVTAAWLLTYANLSPLPPNARIAEVPVADWALDGRNDFAAIWDASRSAVVHFHPRDQRIHDALSDLITVPTVDYGPIGRALAVGTPTDAQIAALAMGLDDSYAPGAYVALTTVPAPEQHQIGYDATPFCDAADEFVDNILALPTVFPGLALPIPKALLGAFRCDRTRPSEQTREGWVHFAEDAWSDAADGELSASSLAAGEVNAALLTPLVFDGLGAASAAVVLSLGPDARSARSALDAMGPPEETGSSATATLDAWLAGRRLPTSAPAEVLAVARRALINIRVGTDAATGAVVASVSRQPPYGLDWPRDGAFFNVLFDVSGQAHLVDRRAALYALWQRRDPVSFALLPPPPGPDGVRAYPAGAWEMNYYADPVPGGMAGGVFRFEIDNAAFAVWSLVAHAGWVRAMRPAAYLRLHWETIERGADLLARWRDSSTGLQFPAQEDDNFDYSQTLHGAVTTFGALEIASRAARLLGEDRAGERWEMRAAELRDAILRLLYDGVARRFVSDPGTTFNPGSSPTGPTAWLVWPMRLLDWNDVRVQDQLRADLGTITPVIELSTPGGAYVMKNTLSLALALGTDATIGPELRRLLERLATQATPGTRHFGEVSVTVDDGSGPRADQRTSPPHLWEGALFYLTAMALEAPEELLRYDEVLPPSRVPAPGTFGSTAKPQSRFLGGGACGCTSPGLSRGADGALLGLLVILLGLVRACRRNRAVR